MRLRVSLLLALACVVPACNHGKTPPDPFPDAAPDGVVVTSLSSTRAQVTWNDLSQLEAGFVVETSPDGVVWSDAAVVATNVETAELAGLAPGVLIHIRVAAYTSKGRAWSPSQTFTPPTPAWTQLAISGPMPPAGISSAFDAAQRIMYVAWWNQVDDVTEISALDLDSPTGWTTLSPPSKPPGRSDASLVFASGRLLLFGGGDAVGPLADVWEFLPSGPAWTPLSPSGTVVPRLGHSAVYDALDDRMVVFGGFDGTNLLSEVLVLDLTPAPAWSVFTLAGPRPRNKHSAVLDPAQRRMIIFGGLDNDLTDDFSTNANDLWILDLAALNWSSPPVGNGPDGPPFPRYGHAAVWDSTNNQMILVGGADDGDEPNSEVWMLPFSGPLAWSLSTPFADDAPRSYAAAAFDAVGIQLVLFGGVIDFFLTPSDETWSLDL